MITEKEIAREILNVTKILIDKNKSKQQDRETYMNMGYLIGLMTCLGKYDEFIKTENWLRYTNGVLVEILIGKTDLN